MANYNNDIEKYLKGELTPAEMNALEKKALTDPFLADALAGAESISGHDLSDDLKKIHASLQDRIDEKKRSISPWTWTYRIAAGLLLIAIATYLIISLPGEKGKDSNLALNKEESFKPESPKEEQKKIVESEPQPQKEILENEFKSSEKAEPHPSSRVYKQPENESAAPEEIVTEESEGNMQPVVVEKQQSDKIYKNYSVSDSARESDAFSRSAPVATSAPEAKRKENLPSGNVAAGAPLQKAADKESNKNVKVVKGTVIDAEDGTAMPGVNVAIKDTSIGTTTDINGNFEIPLDDPNTELVFSFVGFTNVELPVDNKDSLNIEMSTDYAALSEVIVVGYAPPRSGYIDMEDKKNNFSYAEPIGGRKAYKNYLVTNMHYPQQALENKVEGKVTVQFTVETNGLLNEFKVLKSIGYGCDEEVIRLIKKGPAWSPNKLNDSPYRGKVKVRLRFTLPK